MKTVSVKCDARDYLPEITEFGGFSFFVMGKVSDTKQVFSKQYDTVLDKPDITIRVGVACQRSQSLVVSISL